LLKIKELDKYIKESPKLMFNTNILKNVKLDMSAEEIKAEQDLVEECARYLREDAIKQLINNL